MGTSGVPASWSTQRNTFMSELEILILGRLSRISRRNIYCEGSNAFNQSFGVNSLSLIHMVTKHQEP